MKVRTSIADHCVCDTLATVAAEELPQRRTESECVSGQADPRGLDSQLGDAELSPDASTCLARPYRARQRSVEVRADELAASLTLETGVSARYRGSAPAATCVRGHPLAPVDADVVRLWCRGRSRHSKSRCRTRDVDVIPRCRTTDEARRSSTCVRSVLLRTR